MRFGQVHKKLWRARRSVVVAVVVTVPLMLAAAPAVAAPTGSISGRVVDGDDNPLSGICVDVEKGPGVQTDATGVYSITGLDTETYKVGFTDCNGTPQFVEQWYVGKPDASTGDPVTVTDGIDTPLADVTMARGVAVSGTVTDTNGTPLSNMTVSVSPTSPGLSSTATRTDANGGYTTKPLPPAEYKVQFADATGMSNYATQYWKGKASWNAADPLTLSLADGPVHGGVDAQLNVAGTLEGTVTNVDRNPLAGICVDATVLNGGGWDTVGGSSTGSDGEYTISRLPAADLRIRHECSNGPYLEQWYDSKSSANDSTPVVLGPGEVRQGIDAQLAPGVSVSGTVTDPDENPIEGINVNVDPVQNPGANAWGRTDASGTYTTSALPAGDYQVRFTDSNPTPAWGSMYWDGKVSRNDASVLTIGAGDPPVRGNVDAVLSAGATVTGTVSAPGGGPVARECVIAVVSSGNGADGIGFTTTAPDGSYTLSGLPVSDPKIFFQDCNGVGPYVDEWWDDQRSMESAAALSLTPGITRSGIDAQLAAAASIQGTVTDVDGHPLEGICAQATTTTAVGGLTRTDSSGRYSINLADPGSYRVQFVDCNDTPAFAGQWWDHQANAANAMSATVAPGQTVSGVDAALAPGAVGTISGTVKNLNGVAMTTACVVAYLPDGYARFASVSPDGSYTIPDIPSGTYSLAFLGCGGNDPGPIVPDPQSAVTSYTAMWWGGTPVLLAGQERGPDPIAQGATLVTVGPGQDLTGYDWCFGCGAIAITGITQGNRSLTVAFTTPFLEPFGTSALQAAAVAGFTYTVTCSSSNGGAAGTASGSASPITVTGLTPGATYSCRVTASDGTVMVASSSEEVAVVAASANPADPTDPTAKTVSFQAVSPSGGLARTGTDAMVAARLGAALLVLGLALAVAGRSRRGCVTEGPRGSECGTVRLRSVNPPTRPGPRAR